VIASGDVTADLISALFTGTQLDVAATDQIRQPLRNRASRSVPLD
jgi:hypothetical protein